MFLSPNSSDPAPTATFSARLSPGDRMRVRRVLHKFRRHGFCDFDITGSLAIGLHRAHHGIKMAVRPLNDIDIVVSSFNAVPDALAEEFLVLHVHPGAPAGKIVIQLVDVAGSLRIDVISASGGTRERSKQVNTDLGSIRIVSIDDLTARTGRLMTDLNRGVPVAQKFSDHFLWLSGIVDAAAVEAAWQDHRNADDPSAFAEAKGLIQELLTSQQRLLIEPTYSQDVDAICPKCSERAAWKLSPAQQVMSVLGYV